jgi:LmbE family N-acetylglucosaminyl deacetylase
MTGVELPIPSRALAIGAHPDDIEFGCGATLAQWAAAGAEVHLLVLTDGSKGTWDPAADLDTLISTRAAEQRDAATVLGAAGVTQLGYVDGELVDGPVEREAVSAVIRRIRPDVLLGHDPWKRYRLHPDHRAAGFLTIDALVAARDPHFFPEQGLEPHRPSRLLLFEAQDVDHVEPVDETAVAAKIASLLAHASQWRSTMEIDPDGPDVDEQRRAFEQRIEAELRAAGGALGAAEAFKLVTEL